MTISHISCDATNKHNSRNTERGEVERMRVSTWHHRLQLRRTTIIASTLWKGVVNVAPESMVYEWCSASRLVTVKCNHNPSKSQGIIGPNAPTPPDLSKDGLDTLSLQQHFYRQQIWSTVIWQPGTCSPHAVEPCWNTPLAYHNRMMK